MKNFSTLSALFTLALLLTACGQSPEMTFDEKAALDGELAETRHDISDAKDKADEEKFATMQPTDEDGDGYKTFTEADYGVSFDFPSNWEFDIDSYGADGYRVNLSNEKNLDGCTASSAQISFTFPNLKDAELSFADFVKSPEMYDQGGSLGQLGGTLTEMTIAGQSAFHADSTGYEAVRCGDDAYVVEMDEISYLFIGLFTGTAGNEATEVEKIFDSLKID